jgi:hypothetical protein
MSLTAAVVQRVRQSCERSHRATLFDSSLTFTEDGTLCMQGLHHPRCTTCTAEFSFLFLFRDKFLPVASLGAPLQPPDSENGAIDRAVLIYALLLMSLCAQLPLPNSNGVSARAHCDVTSGVRDSNLLAARVDYKCSTSAEQNSSTIATCPNALGRHRDQSSCNSNFAKFIECCSRNSEFKQTTATSVTYSSAAPKHHLCTTSFAGISSRCEWNEPSLTARSQTSSVASNSTASTS